MRDIIQSPDSTTSETTGKPLGHSDNLADELKTEHLSLTRAMARVAQLNARIERDAEARRKMVEAL